MPCVRLLLGRKADVDGGRDVSAQDAPLLVCARHGHADCMTALVEGGAVFSPEIAKALIEILNPPGAKDVDPDDASAPIQSGGALRCLRLVESEIAAAALLAEEDTFVDEEAASKKALKKARQKEKKKAEAAAAAAAAAAPAVLSLIHI